MNARTEAYQRYGLHAIRNLDEKEAWINHLKGRTVRLHDLPTNGDRCTEHTIGGSTCGYPHLIDGTCPNSVQHGETEIEVTDAMLDAALSEVPDELVHIAARFMGASIRAALRAQGVSDE